MAQGSFGTRLETVSNYFRAETNQLSQHQISDLIELGWNPPTGSQIYGTPECDPDGSPNFFHDAAIPIDFAALAGMAVRTFIEILHISHPGFLQYECFDGAGNTISLSELGLKRADAANQKDAMPQLLIDTLKEVTGISDWFFDEEGDLGGIKYGSATTHIQLLEDEQYVRLYSIILEDAKESLQLLARLNELNSENGYMHLVCKDGVVIALSDLQVIPFVNNHLVNALGNFCQIVDGFHDILNAEFGKGATLSEQPLNQQITH